jgi:predicted membrane-bound dolichyl-phosphate-mannose-protein mannosyltransferase
MLKRTWLNKRLIITIFIFLLGLGIRLYGTTTPAQIYDMPTFEAWSRLIWVHGPVEFFNKVWSDYTPLPILTFAPISLLADFLKMPFSLTFKLVHVFLELTLIMVIPGLPLLVRSLLLFSPALIGDNAFWGQVDTIPALLGLLSLTTMSPLALGLAVAYKPIMILIAPIIWIKDIKRGRYWQLPIYSMIIFFLTAIPTGRAQFITHIFNRITSQTGTYPHLTINAFNFWSLVPVNAWISDSTSVLNISGRTFGLTVFALLTLIILNSWRKAKFAPEYAARVIATIMIAFFTFTTRMHERHLLFGLPFLTLAVATQTWLLLPLIIVTTTFTLNLYGAFAWVNNLQAWPFSLFEISAISWATVLTALALATVWDWPVFVKKVVALIAKHKSLCLILLLAAVLRLYNLSYPSEYVFDEVYHAFTAREYANNHIQAWEWWTTPPPGVAYEWTHPPVAKYGMVIGILLFGENSFGWRLGSAVFGVISIYGLYLLVHALTKNKSIALLSAFLVSLEGLHLSQSRIAMNDIYMLAFLIWSLYLAVKSRWKGSAILYGLALGSKWSALYGVVPLAYLYLNQTDVRHWSLKSTLTHLVFILRLLLIVLSTYVLTFTPFILAGHTWAQWWELHRQMWYYHTHLVATHAYQSTPIQWLFASRPVWYFVKYSGEVISNIYAQSNPLILWTGLIALVLQLKLALNKKYALFFLLYIIFTLPWVFSPRIMFFYHYLPSAVFLSVILATWLSTLPQPVRYFLLTLIVAVFLLLSPLWYGFFMSQSYWQPLFELFPSWK